MNAKVFPGASPLSPSPQLTLSARPPPHPEPLTAAEWLCSLSDRTEGASLLFSFAPDRKETNKKHRTLPLGED